MEREREIYDLSQGCFNSEIIHALYNSLRKLPENIKFVDIQNIEKESLMNFLRTYIRENPSAFDILINPETFVLTSEEKKILQSRQPKTRVNALELEEKEN